jgi:hypothetical protein
MSALSLEKDFFVGYACDSTRFVVYDIYIGIFESKEGLIPRSLLRNERAALAVRLG